eukprot:m.121909 g.121909  ORF g.121909 m.121909 type:complete len:568 (-) comp21925_c0_seq2:97-1800(-)
MSGSVEIQLGDGTWQVDARYQPLKLIGSGAYGVVCSAHDRKTGKEVAIKKIQKAFDIVTIAKRTLLEIKLLRHFQSHENVITIEGILQPPPAPLPFNDVYVVMELMESDLHRIIYSKQKLTSDHVRYFLWQLLRGLKYIHSAKVVHRDIKPGNLLVTSKCDLKICDFGMARGISANPLEHAGFMTAYVATRWYRAPEVMLSFKEYTYGIDLWSAACIFAEMLGRKHLFPSRTYVEHLNLVLKHLGLPSDSCISRIGSQKAQKYLRSLNPIQSPPLQEVYPHASADAIDLLQKMLKFDPDERISIEDALGHPYLKEHHDLTDEPSCTEFDFDFEAESGELSAQDYREKILEEVQAYTASLERPSSTGSVFPVSPSPFGGGGFPVSPSPAFKFGGSGARVSPSAFPSSGTFTASPSARPFPGSPVTRSAATRESKRRRTDSASASSANGDSPKEWAAAMAARIGSRTPPPVAARKKKAAASPPPVDWAAGGAAAAAVASVVPTRTVSSASSGSIASHAQLASGKLLSTPDGASCVDVQWLDHVDPNWLTDQQLQTELEMGAPNVFKNPP